MSSLVLELQKKSLESSMPLTILLREALAVATKLDLNEFRLWIDNELDGYTQISEIPKYRYVSGAPSFIDAYGTLQRLIVNDVEYLVRLSKQPTDRPIGEIEYLLKQSTHNPLINLEYTEKVAVELMRNEKLTSKPFLLLNHSSLQGLIDSVRNIILKWTLQLEKDGILGEGMTFTKQEKQVASSTVYHIETYIGKMLNSQIQQGTHDSVQSMSSNAIDLEKLKIVVESIEKSVASLEVAPDKQTEILADLSTIKSQSSSPEPKISIIRECMHSIRNIIEGATGSVIAAQLLPKIEALLR